MTAEMSYMLQAIFPELGLLILIGLVLVLDLAWKDGKRRVLGWVTFFGLVIILAASLIISRPPEASPLIWGGMLRDDMAAYVFRMIFLVGAAITTLFTMDHEELAARGEFYILMLTSTLGMNFMASAADLIMLFLAIETTTIPLFVLAGFLTRDQKSVESGIKYLIFGAMTSAVMLYGFSLIYGFSGTTQIYEVAQRMQIGQVPNFAIIAAALLMLVGFGFKVSAVPFHFWAPDVYEGAPYPVAGFLSTASKAAGFAVLGRVLFVLFPDLSQVWVLILALLAIASMVTGNLLAMVQKNIKRLLAYSSIAQAGYMLVGVAAYSQLGTTGLVYYLAAYLLTNLAAFGIIGIVSREVGSDEISAYAGLSRRSPGIAMAMLVVLLSLAGIPPFAGFIGKLLVFAAAVESGLIWLALIGIINTIVALFYYLSILKVVYLYRSEDEQKPLTAPYNSAAALIVCVLGIVVLGVLIAPWFALSSGAASAIVFFP